MPSCQRPPPFTPQATNVRYPLTAVAYLTAQTLSGSRIGCSGTVVGAEARTVITAAHCESQLGPVPRLLCMRVGLLVNVGWGSGNRGGDEGASSAHRSTVWMWRENVHAGQDYTMRMGW